MSRSHSAFRLMACALVIVVGLGLGFWIARHWGANTSPPQELALAATPVAAQRPAERSRGSDSDPDREAKAAGKHALLVGVTKYDHLPKDKHLSGPANDVRLMLQLLEQGYQFAANAIVSLTEDEGQPDRRPTRANIAREFRRLAEQAREGDQVVILLAGHGARQPADPDNREPDGIDEIFLPADVDKWRGFPDKVPNAIVDKEMGKWLQAITTKKAHVWIIFDCCHSGTMTRGTEVVRELPPGLLVPKEELDKARQRAAQREKTRGEPEAKSAAFVPQEPSDYLVAVYACREYESTPESPQPVESAKAEYHGLLTYSLVKILTESAGSKAPLTYQELVQRLQVSYAARPQGSPTPLVEGKGQIQVVLGTEQPARPRLLLSQDEDVYKVNAGDLYGLTTGSVLAVYSPAGDKVEPKLLGHVRVGAVEPFEATVEPCAYEKSPLVKEFPPLSTCKPVFIDYRLSRFKVAVHVPEGQAAIRQKLLNALEPLSGAKDGLVEIVDEKAAEWLVRLEKGKVQLIEASGNQAPFALPDPDSPNLSEALRRNLGKVFRARNLIAIAERFEGQRNGGDAAVDVEVQVLRHKSKSTKDAGEVSLRPSDGWLLRPGHFISFRLKNNSSIPVDVTLLIVGSDFAIQPFYPSKGELAKSLKPGETIDTPPPWGAISNDPPFGKENLVVIAVPAQKTPADFSALAQDGLERARSADRSESLRSPLGELLESAMFRSGSRRGLTRTFAGQHGMRVLTWRTEPK
jgi:uncharacterized caspase-like protein